MKDLIFMSLELHKGRRGKGRAEKALKETMAENFPTLGKDGNLCSSS